MRFSGFAPFRFLLLLGRAQPSSTTRRQGHRYGFGRPVVAASAARRIRRPVNSGLGDAEGGHLLSVAPGVVERSSSRRGLQDRRRRDPQATSARRPRSISPEVGNPRSRSASCRRDEAIVKTTLRLSAPSRVGSCQPPSAARYSPAEAQRRLHVRSRAALSTKVTARRRRRHHRAREQQSCASPHRQPNTLSSGDRPDRRGSTRSSSRPRTLSSSAGQGAVVTDDQFRDNDIPAS